MKNQSRLDFRLGLEIPPSTLLHSRLHRQHAGATYPPPLHLLTTAPTLQHAPPPHTQVADGANTLIPRLASPPTDADGTGALQVQTAPPVRFSSCEVQDRDHPPGPPQAEMHGLAQCQQAAGGSKGTVGRVKRTANLWPWCVGWTRRALGTGRPAARIGNAKVVISAACFIVRFMLDPTSRPSAHGHVRMVMVGVGRNVGRSWRSGDKNVL